MLTSIIIWRRGQGPKGKVLAAKGEKTNEPPEPAAGGSATQPLDLWFW